MRRLVPLAAATAVLLITAGPTLACGGLIGPNGAVNLLRTTTFAGYHDGIEHYVTSFAFAGGEGEFGSLVPLPDVPTSVERGGDWTLQRLVAGDEPAARVPGPGCRGRRLGTGRGPARGPDRRPRHHRPARRRARGRRLGHRARLPAPAGRARGPGLLRQPLPDLPGRGLRCRCGRRPRAGGWRRDPGPPDHPDRRPVGSAPHPGPRQVRGRDRGSGRVPADR